MENSILSNSAPNHRNTHKLKQSRLPPSNPPTLRSFPTQELLWPGLYLHLLPPPFGRVKVLIAPLMASVIACPKFIIKGGGVIAMNIVRAVQNPAAAMAAAFGLPPGPHKYQRPPGRELYRGLSRILLFILAHLPHWLALTPSAARKVRAALASGRVAEKLFYKILGHTKGSISKRPDGVDAFPLRIQRCASLFTCRSHTWPCVAVTSSRCLIGLMPTSRFDCPFTAAAPYFD